MSVFGDQAKSVNAAVATIRKLAPTDLMVIKAVGVLTAPKPDVVSSITPTYYHDALYRTIGPVHDAYQRATGRFSGEGSPHRVITARLRRIAVTADFALGRRAGREDLYYCSSFESVTLGYVMTHLVPDLAPEDRDMLEWPVKAVIDGTLDWWADPQWRNLFAESVPNIGPVAARDLVQSLI